MRLSKVFPLAPVAKRWTFFLLFAGMAALVFHDYLCPQHHGILGMEVSCQKPPLHQGGEGKSYHESFHAPCAVAFAVTTVHPAERTVLLGLDEPAVGLDLFFPPLKPPIA